jgi:hypothetical protein
MGRCFWKAAELMETATFLDILFLICCLPPFLVMMVLVFFDLKGHKKAPRPDKGEWHRITPHTTILYYDFEPLVQLVVQKTCMGLIIRTYDHRKDAWVYHDEFRIEINDRDLFPDDIYEKVHPTEE